MLAINRGRTAAARSGFGIHGDVGVLWGHHISVDMQHTRAHAQWTKVAVLNDVKGTRSILGVLSSRPTSQGAEHAILHFGNDAYSVGAGHTRANVPIWRRSESRINSRRELLSEWPYNTVAQRHEQPARPWKLRHSRRTQRMPADAAQAATDLSREPSVI
jgi:hypothetical protein